MFEHLERFWHWLRSPWRSNPSLDSYRGNSSQKPQNLHVVLKITQDSEYSIWQEALRGGKKQMIVVARLQVCNVGSAPVFQIREAYIREPHVKADFSAVQDSLYRGRNVHVLTLHFSIVPPVITMAEIFIADVALVDQYGKEHQIEKMNFKPMVISGWSNLKSQLGLID